MTTVNDLTKPPARRPACMSKAEIRSAEIAGTLSALAVGSWLTGLGLNKGFGVHVPFLAAFFVAIGALFFLKQFVAEAATTWHDHRVKADTRLVAAQMALRPNLPDLSNVDFGKMFADLGIDKPSADDGPNPYL